LSRPLSNGTGIASTIRAPVPVAWLNRYLDSASTAIGISTTRQANTTGQAGGGPVLGWVSNAVSIQAALLAPVIAFCHRLIARRRRRAEPLATRSELIRNK
jgi:hypothetical protein